MPAPTNRFKSWAPPLALVALTIVCYLPAIRAGFIWDDPDYVVDNANLRSQTGLYNIWFIPRSLPQYYPLVHTTFWVEYHLWQLNPAGYHIVNILLHALSAILLWRVLSNLQISGAWLAAAIWAVHPTQVESVAWITERKNVLSAAFYLGAALAYLRSIGVSPVRSDSHGRDAHATNNPNAATFWYAISLLLFFGALLSKTVTCSFPAATLLILWWKRDRLTKKDILPLLPFFALGLAFACYTAHLERAHVGAAGPEWNFTFIQRLLIASRALWFYAGKILLPINLSFIYPRWSIDTHELWQWFFPVAALFLFAILALLQRRFGKGPIVAALFFAGTLVPALGFVNVYPMRYTFIADHYTYLASIGLVSLIAAGLARVRASYVLLLPLAILTCNQSRIYHDPITLWSDTLAKNPNSWMVHMNLAHAFVDAGEPDKADPHFHRALALAPLVPETHWEVGINYASRGRFDDAMREYNNALTLNPEFAHAYYGRGNIYRARGNVVLAEYEYRKALEHFPTYPEAHLNLGVVLEDQGKFDEAFAHYLLALSARPDYALAHNRIGRLFVRRRESAPALWHFRQAVRINPDLAEAHLNLGAVLAAIGQRDEAIVEVREAVRLDPSLSKYADQALK